jgi:UDP-N-acetylglucosamine 2-epimerase (non-hydrolysing)
LLEGSPLKWDENMGFAANGDPIEYGNALIRKLLARFYLHRPTMVIVQGDTASAWAAALAANVPVAHVEAGIRTHDLDDPWPEEMFRQGIDAIATYHFCATLGNAINLNILEPIRRHVHITGNTGIDYLYQRQQPVPWEKRGPNVLVTLHRRESFGEKLEDIIRGIIRAAREHYGAQFLWPAHPNPRVQKAIEDVPYVCWPGNFTVTDPLPPDEFVKALANARAVVTDSGGVQEEAAALGVPAVVARDHTDRPESVEAGLAILAGRQCAGVATAISTALSNMQHIEPSTCFGDGKASSRIADHLLSSS